MDTNNERCSHHSSFSKFNGNRLHQLNQPTLRNSYKATTQVACDAELSFLDLITKWQGGMCDSLSVQNSTVTLARWHWKWHFLDKPLINVHDKTFMFCCTSLSVKFIFLHPLAYSTSSTSRLLGLL